MNRADAADAALVVLVLRTPGGLVDSTRDINTSIIEAETPVVVYVGPSGARAASAGFLITIAADVAAMAPGTHIGAAHPVSGTGEAMDDTAAEKAASDVAAYARSLATQRRRNVRLAERAVTNSESFTETEALEADPPLIDLVADDLDSLLEALDGRVVTRWDGSTQVLRTAGAPIEHIEMNWRQRLLSAIAHPQIAVLLFSLGTLGLTIELWTPGAVLPGVAGGICLLLAFFAFQIMPINYVGLLLVVFGLVLLILEMVTAAFGVLAAGGVISMIFGLAMLIDSPAPELQLGWPFILSTMLALAAIVGFLARLSLRAQRRPAVTGRAGMLDESGEVIDDVGPGVGGRVSTHGEIWSAIAPDPAGNTRAGGGHRRDDSDGVARAPCRSGPGARSAHMSPILIFAVVVALYLANSVKILNEYERGVIFRLGKLLPRPKGPGVVLVFAPIDRMVRVGLRTIVMDVPPQDIITRDNVSVKVNAVLYFRVMDPAKAIVEVESFTYATSQLAQTTLRSVLGQVELDDLLSERERLNQDLQRLLDQQTDPWGIKIAAVEVKHVDLPENMQRAMARQAEAEREKRAKIIHAEGEFNASERLSQAADIMGGQPLAITLRYLQTLTEIAGEKNSTIVFPLPIELLNLLQPKKSAGTDGEQPPE